MGRIEAIANSLTIAYRDDVAQEMRLSMWQGNDEKAARCDAIDYLRSPAVSSSYNSDTEHISLDRYLEDGFDIRVTYDPDATMDAQAIMESCSVSIRQTFHNWFWEGLSLAEEAEQYKCGTETVRKRRYRAIKAVREKLGL